MDSIAKRIDCGFGKKIYLLGVDKYGDYVWLETPKWDCGWYWGFGYIERYTNNKYPSRAKDITSHTHWDSEIVGKKGNDYIHHLNENPDFKASVLTEAESWELADLMQTFYTLKTTAAIFHQGNSHLTSTKGCDLKDLAAEERINKVLLPKVFARIDNILSPTE